MIARALLLSSLVLALMSAALYSVYKHGFKYGFEAAKTEQAKSERALAARIAELEQRGREAQEELAREAEEARKHAEVALLAQRAEYEQRLSRSALRADVYRAQAEAGASSARALADHAARLDRALEEGVGLVEELSGALGLREAQLRIAGEQLRRDRLPGEGMQP